MMQGKSGLAYLGVNALNPPDVIYKDRAPTFNDYVGYDLMHLWHVTLPTTPATYELWYLADKSTGYATWIKMYPQGGAGGGNLRSDDLLIEIPDPVTGAINVYGGEPYGGDVEYINMYTTRLDANTLYVNLKRSINQPFTNVTGTEGVYSLGKINFLHAYGTNNTFLGLNGVSIPTIDPLIAVNNTACGAGALHSIDGASNCVALGYNAAEKTTDGVHVICIGVSSGSALDPADSSCILIGNPGKNTESNAIHIGVSGAGDGEVDKCYIGGIWNIAPVPGRDTGLVIIDEEDKLCTYNTEINSILGTDANGNPIALKGAVGTVLTGRGSLPADPMPEFLPIESAGGTVTISTNPITGSVNLEAAGVAGLVTLTSDTGVVLPLLANINVLGGELINTDNLVANTVTVNLDRSTQDPAVHCEILTGSGPLAASTYKELWSSDGSILFDLVSDPTKIDITAPGGGGGALTNLKDMNDIACNPVAGVIKIDAGDNIETTTTGPGFLEVRVTDSVELLSGHLKTRDYIETTNGDVILGDGNLRLPATNNTGTAGIIRFNNIATMHCYGGASTTNIFVGPVCGNWTTLDTATSRYNSGLGRDSLKSLTTSPFNTACGAKIFDVVTSGYGYNTGIGYAAGSKLATGAYNTFLGEFAGYNCTGSDSHNLHIRNAGVAGDNRMIRIGTDGAVNGGQTSCYIAAIYGKTPGPSAQMVTIGSDGKLGTAGLPSGGAIAFVTDSGTANVSGTTIQVKGGANINTSGATNIVTVNLDTSVKQPMSKASPTSNQGVYALYDSAGAGSYNTDRFMHAWGATMGVDAYNTFLGRQSGKISLTSIGLNNTGIGANALDAYTSGSNNTALGKNALGAVTSGSSNIAIGSNAGNSITSTSYNIYLGNPGVLAESRTMKLGYTQVWSVPAPDPHHPDPVETLTTHGTDNTYCYGIYRNTVAYSGTPVYVDHLGKLGTEGGVMFAFRQTTTVANATGDNTVYVFGTSGGITEDFDNTNSLVLGGAGAPTVFTAPYSGKYVFTASITMLIPLYIPPAPPPRPNGCGDPLYVVTSNLSYTYTNVIPPSNTSNQYVSEIVTTVCYLDAGDTVRWACAAGAAGQPKTISILNYLPATIPGVGVKTCYATYFTGYRVS